MTERHLEELAAATDGLNTARQRRDEVRSAGHLERQQAQEREAASEGGAAPASASRRSGRQLRPELCCSSPQGRTTAGRRCGLDVRVPGDGSRYPRLGTLQPCRRCGGCFFRCGAGVSTTRRFGPAATWSPDSQPARWPSPATRPRWWSRVITAEVDGPSRARGDGSRGTVPL